MAQDHEPLPQETGAPVDIEKVSEVAAPQPRKISLKESLGKKGVFWFSALGIVLGGAVLYYTLTGSGSGGHVAVPPPPPVDNVIGSHAVTPQYAKETHEAEKQQYETAIKTNTSAFPYPKFTPKAPPPLPGTDSTPAAAAPPTIDVVQAPAVGTLNSLGAPGTENQTGTNGAGAYQSGAAGNQANPYLTAVSKFARTKSNKNSAGVSFVVENDLPKRGTMRSAALAAQEAAAANAQDSAASSASQLVPAAGTILPAKIINYLDTDNPGVVLAEITEGPLRGSRLIGSFQSGKSGLELRFTSMSVPINGGATVKTVSVQAAAISLSDTPMASSVNYHFMSNLFASFVSGLGSTIGSILPTEGTTVATSGTGLAVQSTPQLSLPTLFGSAAGQAVGAAGQQYEQIYGNQPVTIKLNAGYLFSVVFLGASKQQNSVGPQPAKLTPAANINPYARFAAPLPYGGVPYAPVGLGAGYAPYGTP